MIRNIVNDKKYIGQAHDISYRWMHHKCDLNGNMHHNRHLQSAWNIYGSENFEFTVIEETQDSELNEREKYWILYYDSYNNGYNLDLGGAGANGYKHTDDELYRMRRIQNPDVVLQFDMDFNFIKQWDGGISHISKKLKYTKECILLRCTHNIITMSPYKDYYWVFKEEYENPKFSWENYLLNISLYDGKKLKKKNTKKIYQYSFKKELVKIWDSLSDIRKEFGNTSSISAILYHRKGKRSAYGYIWTFEDYDFSDGYFEDVIKKNNEIHIEKEKWAVNKKKIAKIDPNSMQIIQMYNSMTDAALDVGNKYTLSRICTAAQTYPNHKCRGFLWRYIE